MATTPAKKACDACHRRKVRCTGGQPCKNCGQSSLQCTYLAIPQKKGPKGSRAKVISEIRDTQQQAAALISPTKCSTVDQSDQFDFNSSPITTPFAPTPGLLSPQTIEICIDFFFQHLYPTMPILERQRIQEMTELRHPMHGEEYCLIAALCAFVMVQPGMTISVSGVMGESFEGEPPQSRYGYAKVLLDDLLRVRKGCDYIDKPSMLSVQTAFFLFCSFFSLENQKRNACWFHLREAATLAQMMNMHDEASYAKGHQLDDVYRRRTYWLVFLTERAYAIERHKFLTLHDTIDLPAAEGEDEEVINGFVHLINLFRCIDDEFICLWNKARTQCSTTWLSQLQDRLVNAVPNDLRTTNWQEADIRITRHWLRTIVWQLSIMNSNLSSNSQTAAMTFTYPIDIANDLLIDVRKMDVQSLEVHGVGLIEKLFDVACTLVDVIAFVPLDSSNEHGKSPQEFLSQFLSLVSQLRGGSSRYLPLLLSKVSDLPSMTAPVHHMPLSIKQGYAGASDNLPTPNMPQDFDPISGTMPNGPLLSLHQSNTSHQGHNQGAPLLRSTTPATEHALLFDTYSSPSVGALTNTSYPQGGHNHQPRLSNTPPLSAVGVLYGR